ncbi:MAG: S41 family peptidase [bacterium]|nr:S41 family peptidase [bacterium]
MKKIIDKIKNFRIVIDREKETYSSGELLVLMFVSIAFGMMSMFAMVKAFTSGKDYVTLNRDLGKLVDAYNIVVDNYDGDIDKEKMIDNAISGMMSGIEDPYTTYSTSQNAKKFLEKVSGTYEGIGCEVYTDDEGNIVVGHIVEGGPSEKAHLQENDIIIEVDNESFVGKTSNDLATYIKNSDNKKVMLKVKRAEEEVYVTIKKDDVESITVASSTFTKNNKKIGYIYISIFSTVTTKQFTNAYDKLLSENIDGLVIDVRGNIGGYLDVVTDITSLILPKDKIIYHLEDDGNKTTVKDNNDKYFDKPIAILINGTSASASEILASAVKESYGGEVIGTKSFGKGTVQSTLTLSDGSMVKYTAQKWYTPEGNSVINEGVIPTNIIELSEEYKNNPSNDTDNQLQTALDLASK